ncbi:hypothetical protein SERLA73DRAFT_150260 [Serpula lacrymans var. lacrymans S7.3]|uniref:Uncharacterized protein n=1 Tax=Serpula lacrymans var. lacrymans (strain S7.3) TaxID=936435 RepID=F8PLT1_SERL3|nr:hypothetical protein SERLA73DRAFT_150260 [Serpula lacrymans var. lacrymans S7.3]
MARLELRSSDPEASDPEAGGGRDPDTDKREDSNSDSDTDKDSNSQRSDVKKAKQESDPGAIYPVALSMVKCKTLPQCNNLKLDLECPTGHGNLSEHEDANNEGESLSRLFKRTKQVQYSATFKGMHALPNFRINLKAHAKSAWNISHTTVFAEDSVKHDYICNNVEAVKKFFASHMKS